MINSKAIEVLKTLNQKEFKDLGRFISSPYFNTNKDIISLYEALKPFYPEFNNEPLSKEYLYKKLYGNSGYRDDKMRLLFSEMMSLGERFLAQVNFDTGAAKKYEYLLPELEKRRLDSMFEKSMKFYEESFNLENETPEQIFFDRYSLSIIKKNYKLNRLAKGEEVLKSADSRSINFIYFTLIKLIEQALEYRTAGDLNNIDTGLNPISRFISNIDLDNIVNTIIKNKLEHSRIIEMYYMMYQMITKEKDKYYYRLKELLRQNYKTLSPSWRFAVYLKMLDYCIIRSRGEKTNNQYDLEQHKLRRFMIEKGIYSFSGSRMNPNFFRNTVTNGLILKKFEWVESFVTEKLEKLPPEHRINLKNYSLALISFEKGAFEKALEYASNVKLINFILKLDIKVLSLKIYYELNVIEPAVASASSFRKFLTGNKEIPEVFRKRHQEFLHFYNELVKIKSGMKGPDIRYLKNQLDSRKGFKDDIWVLNKLNELEIPSKSKRKFI